MGHCEASFQALACRVKLISDPSPINNLLATIVTLTPVQ
jgi:hypothetical protein